MRIYRSRTIGSLIGAAALLVAGAAYVAMGQAADQPSLISTTAQEPATPPQYLYIADHFNEEKRKAIEFPLPDQF